MPVGSMEGCLSKKKYIHINDVFLHANYIGIVVNQYLHVLRVHMNVTTV